MSSLAHPRIDLDAGHVSHISHLTRGETVPSNQRAAYSAGDRFIRTHNFGLVYNPAPPLEWVDGQATLESANQIADVVQSARLIYYFAGDQFTYTAAVLNECRRVCPRLNTPSLPI